MNQLKTKSLPVFKKDYLDGQILEQKEARTYDMMSSYTIFESNPTLYIFLTCKVPYMHHIDYKYSTLDNTFDKNSTAIDQHYTDMRIVSHQYVKKDLTSDELEKEKYFADAIVIRSSYYKNKISPYFFIQPFSPEEFKEREERRNRAILEKNSNFKKNPNKITS